MAVRVVPLLVERALAILEEDDMNPEVGMGMFMSEAVAKAASDLMFEAPFWGVELSITAEDKEKAAEAARKKRTKRP